MPLEVTDVRTLFPIPLVTFRIDDADLNRQLLSEIEQRRATESGLKRSNRQGWHSADDFFQRREPAQVKLAGLMREAVLQVTRQLAPESDLSQLDLICEGWINSSPTGAYNSPHDHTGFLWSGVYYLVMPSDGAEESPSSGRLEFISSVRMAKGPIKGDFTSSKTSIRPKPGTLLLFPSNVLHWVHPNAAGAERVTVAFNAQFIRRRPSAAQFRS
jgi:uncharacterized protein (TIGR02466 family)